MEIKLNNSEIEVLRKTLINIVVKSRTGEIVILHGVDRFVSSNNTLKKDEIDSLEIVLNKIGIAGLKRTD